jgi:hypothetical protein
MRRVWERGLTRLQTKLSVVIIVLFNDFNLKASKG